MCKALIPLLGFLLLVSLIRCGSAEDIGILCDVSKSMKNLWLSEGREAIKELVLYGRIPPGWDLSSAHEQYEFLVSHTSPVGVGDEVLLLEFGSVVRSQFPYFREPRWIRVENMVQIGDLLEESFPSQVKDSWTYELLAEATASKLIRDSFGSNEWYLVVLSDFIEDHGFTLTDEQIDLVDRFETEVDLSFSIPAIIRWKRHSDLQIKILRVTVGAKPEPEEEQGFARDLLALLAPQDAVDFEGSRKIGFSWRWEGDPEDIIDYLFLLRHKQRQGYKIVYNQQLSRTRFTCPKDLEPGSYEWYVKANTRQGSVISSKRRGFEVKGRSALPWLILVLLIIVGGIVFLRYILPRLQAKKRRKRSELGLS